MSYRRLKSVLIGSVILIIAWSLYSILFYAKPVIDRIDVIIIAVTTGIISGFVSNFLFRNFEKQRRLALIKKKLSGCEGNYDVFHWRDLEIPDTLNYKVIIEVDAENAILKIKQTGSEDAHVLWGDIKMNEETFTYGEGNYCHPKKLGYPNGRMQLYIVGSGIINVDKYYLDDNGQKPGYEKWKWKKIK